MFLPDVGNSECTSRCHDPITVYRFEDLKLHTGVKFFPQICFLYSRLHCMCRSKHKCVLVTVTMVGGRGRWKGVCEIRCPSCLNLLYRINVKNRKPSLLFSQHLYRYQISIYEADLFKYCT